jgi:hypothetical protein
MNITNEMELMAHLKENWKKYSLSKFHKVSFDCAVYGCISDKRIGLIDIILYNKKSIFVGEVKFTGFSSTNLWESLKILGYSCALNLYHFKKNRNSPNFYHPFVMVPKENITYDFLPILYHLKCGYITFDIKDDWIDFDINLNYHSENFI